MGLTLFVGQLAAVAKDEPESLAMVGLSYERLNEVLADAGMDPHHEPIDVPEDHIVEFAMWGYAGLHSLRRLAAHYARDSRLPQVTQSGDHAADPVLESLSKDHEKRLIRRGLSALPFWPFKKGPEPKFQHLIMHSDAEGFYIPRDFKDVVLDTAHPQRDGVGGMVGSSVRLLSECRELAAALDLPSGIDPESEEIWKNAESPPTEGASWRVYGIETFSLVRRMRSCELSMASNSALVFG